MTDESPPLTEFKSHPLKAKHVHEYLAALLLSSAVRALSDRQTQSLARALGHFVYHRWHSRRAICQQNLMRAFPHLTLVEVEEMTQQVFASASQSFLEFARMSKFSATQLNTKVDVDPDSRASLATRQSPVVYVSAHLGNWEYLGRWLAENHGPIALLINPQTNPLVDRMIMKWRSHPRLFFVPYKNGWRQLSHMLQSGISVALLADQRLETGGTLLPFFGHTARWSKLPALLANKHQVPLVPIFLPRQSDQTFRLVLKQEISPVHGADIHTEIVRLTQEYVRSCEQVVRDFPGQYLFTHNRWGIDPARLYESSPHIHSVPASQDMLQSSSTTPISLR